MAMCMPSVSAWVYLVLLSGSEVAQWLYSAAKLTMLALPLIVVLGFERIWPRWRDIQWRAQLRSLPLGFGTGVAIVAIIAATYCFTPIGDSVRANADHIRTATAEMGILDWYIPFCCGLSILHALLEEYYWRWFVHSGLRQFLSGWSLYALGGLAFAGHHFFILAGYFPNFALTAFLGGCIGIGGMIWAWQMDRTKCLAGSWLSHFIVDIAIFAIGYDILFL